MSSCVNGCSPGRDACSVVSHPAVVNVNQEVYRELARRGWDVTIVLPSRWRHEYSRRRWWARRRSRAWRTRCARRRSHCRAAPAPPLPGQLPSAVRAGASRRGVRRGRAVLAGGDAVELAFGRRACRSACSAPRTSTGPAARRCAGCARACCATRRSWRPARRARPGSRALGSARRGRARAARRSRPGSRACRRRHGGASRSPSATPAG